jgi:glycosyltransferase involved in cell wall biosynthesis
MKPRPIAIVLSGFPRRSETFALAEVSALAEQGLLAAVFSTKPGEPGDAQPAARRLAPRVHRLSGEPEAQAAEAARVLSNTRVSGVHAYFAHTPAAIGAALATSLGVPFGFSVHARDARKIGRDVLHARARRAACVVACNTDVLRELNGSGARVQVVPHGVDLEQFAVVPRPAASVLHLLAVGRLVEKKGFHVLLDALSTVDVPWRLRIVGDGPEKARLSAQVCGLGLADRVSFAGAMTHEALPQEYAGADVVLVPSVLDRSGDRDGLPNVVLEAMASGRALVASDMGAIASAIHDGATGLLVPAGDRRALAHALIQLSARRGLRTALGAAARHAAERAFDLRQCTHRLGSVLREAYA